MARKPRHSECQTINFHRRWSVRSNHRSSVSASPALFAVSIRQANKMWCRCCVSQTVDAYQFTSRGAYILSPVGDKRSGIVIQLERAHKLCVFVMEMSSGVGFFSVVWPMLRSFVLFVSFLAPVEIRMLTRLSRSRHWKQTLELCKVGGMIFSEKIRQRVTHSSEYCVLICVNRQTLSRNRIRSFVEKLHTIANIITMRNLCNRFAN